MQPERSAADRRRDGVTAAALVLTLLVAYNLNGREIGSYDTQATKFAARELLLHGTLDVDRVVAAQPAYASRWGFILAADGHYRSIYSPVPSIMAAVIAWPFCKTGVIDVRAPLAPGLMAVMAASLLVALAVAMGFAAARKRVSRVRALWIALGLGLGTGFWNTASQTLWQTESAVFGLALAVLAFAAPRDRIGLRGAAAIAIGLGLAGVTRPQLAPLIAVMLIGTCARSRPRDAIAALLLLGAFAAAICATNLRWFGSVLGALPLLQEINSQVHATGASFGATLEGAAGLLVSPNRGLVVFSPIVLIALAGIRAAVSEGWRGPLFWCVAALAAQFALYSTYAVWWGGHTYGPRYLIDVLPLAVPLAAAAMSRPAIAPSAKLLAAAALVWSMAVAATGAFCYPHDMWNTDPLDVDRHHRRLWEVSDTQIRRCWTRGVSPQNFSLFDRAAVRVPPGP